MTVSEKAAYLKGLADGMELEGKEAKLWSALIDLVSDLAGQVEDLWDSSLEHAEALDDITEELNFVEQFLADSEEDGLYLEDDEDEPDNVVPFCCGRCKEEDEDSIDYEEMGEEDDILYTTVCPECGEEMSFSEEMLDNGSVVCPTCGTELELDLGDEEDGE